PLLAAGLLLGACRSATKPAPAPAPNAPAGANNRPAGAPTRTGPAGGQPQGGVPNLAAFANALSNPGEPAPRPYAAVITARARSKQGVFGVHQVGTRLYFEIPASQLGKDFMVTTVLAGTNAAITG